MTLTGQNYTTGRKTYPIASTPQIPFGLAVGANVGVHFERPVTMVPSDGMAYTLHLKFLII